MKKMEPTDELWIWAQQQREHPSGLAGSAPQNRKSFAIGRLAEKLLSVGRSSSLTLMGRSKSL